MSRDILFKHVKCKKWANVRANAQCASKVVEKTRVNSEREITTEVSLGGFVMYTTVDSSLGIRSACPVALCRTTS